MASPYAGARVRRMMWARAQTPRNLPARWSPMVSCRLGHEKFLPTSTSRVSFLLRNHDPPTPSVTP
eukprot:8747614-Alexandrium_andersonii.AAC.1